jgi:hypothetical protein
MFERTNRMVFKIKHGYHNIIQEAGIVIPYGLDDSVIESRFVKNFPQPSRPALGPTQPRIQRVPGLFPWGKAVGAWVNHPSHLASGLKKE